MDKKKYEQALENSIEAWDGEIESLAARADLILANLEETYYAAIREMRATKREAREELHSLRAAHGLEWEVRRARLDEVGSRVERALDYAKREIGCPSRDLVGGGKALPFPIASRGHKVTGGTRR